jgi:hypothetical protein
MAEKWRQVDDEMAVKVIAQRVHALIFWGKASFRLMTGL